jgi:hypothetical protein
VSRARTATLVVLGARVGYGVTLLTVPQKITRSWLGPAVEGEPTKVALRALAAREIAIHAFGIAAALGGQSVRPWLLASLAGDVNDIAATFVGRSGLPDDAPRKTAVAAGGSAALTAAVLAAASVG